MSKVEIDGERRYSAHHSFVNIAKLSLEEAAKQGPGWANHVQIAIVFSAISLEAICNVVGDVCVEDWEDYESCSPRAKLRVIASKLDISIDKSEEPWSSVYWLTNVRNKIAHPKPVLIKKKYVIAIEDFDPNADPDVGHSDLEKQLNFNNATRAVKAVQELLKALHMALPTEKKFGVIEAMWSWGATYGNRG